MAGLIELAELDLRRVDYEDGDQAQAAIDDASSAVRAYLSRFDVDLDAASADAMAAVKAVTVSIVRRLLDNPRAIMQETLGDYSYSIGGTGGGSLRPTPTERRLLREAVSVSGVRSASMSAPLPLQPSEPSSDPLTELL